MPGDVGTRPGGLVSPANVRSSELLGKAAASLLSLPTLRLSRLQVCAVLVGAGRDTRRGDGHESGKEIGRVNVGVPTRPER